MLGRDFSEVSNMRARHGCFDIAFFDRSRYRCSTSYRFSPMSEQLPSTFDAMPTPTNPDRLQRLKDAFRERIIQLGQAQEEHGTIRQVGFDLTPLYPATKHLSELLEQVDDLRRCLDSFRPLLPEQVTALRSVWDLEYTYESNRIEGNTLTLQETALVIDRGITIAGKSLREHLEATNHAEALLYVRELVEEQLPFTERELKTIHGLILSGIDRRNAGTYRRVPVGIRGSRHRPPEPYLIAKQMEDYFRFYEENQAQQHPVLLAADMHEKLVTIHPFIDGNGRTARLVMNLVLMQNGYPIANISGAQSDRLAYYEALEAVQVDHDVTAFHRLIAQEVKRSLFAYLAMVAPGAEDERGAYFFERIAPLLEEEQGS